MIITKKDNATDGFKLWGGVNPVDLTYKSAGVATDLVFDCNDPKCPMTEITPDNK